MCCLGDESQLWPLRVELKVRLMAQATGGLLELVERWIDPNLGELRLYDVEVQMPDAGKVAPHPPHLYPDAGIEPEQCHLSLP